MKLLGPYYYYCYTLLTITSVKGFFCPSHRSPISSISTNFNSISIHTPLSRTHPVDYQPFAKCTSSLLHAVSNKNDDKFTATGRILVMEEEEDDDDDIRRPRRFAVSLENLDVRDVGNSNNNSEENDVLWRGVVVILCALWASNFAVVKLIMSEPGVDSSLYTVARFSIAALALLPGSIGAIRRGVIDWETAKGAAICGSWVSFGYLGQALGLLSTTASRSCVICSLHCVFVAAVAEFMRVSNAPSNKSFDFMKLVPAAIAVLGVGIVELKGAGGAPSIGDALSFAQPIGFGMGYLQLEELVKKKPDAGLPISAIKLLMVALFSYGLFEFYPSLIQGEEAFVFRLPDLTPILSSPLALGGILYTGLITTALALWVESIAFKRVPATDASIILTTEPLFAAFVGALTLGETFVASDYVGAALIIGACAAAILLDEENVDELCTLDDEMNGICEAPRTRPFSSE